MNMKKTKMMINNHILDHEIKIYDKVIKCVQDYNYFGQKIGACPDHDKNIRRMGMGWSALGKQDNVMKSNLSLLLQRKV